ncbi:MAG: GNAT family N-acetyltransferase [Gammaproteobacteria bacterium]|jgi:RimJ/RimL family protein N-acetyltransferase|nr:GNAT family N-acetyltransferase [Gammaproteobacteria bacterium]
MKPTQLISKRLILRRTLKDDADYLFRYTNDAECSKFLTRAPHTHIDQTKNFLNKWCDLPWAVETDNFAWVVSLASNDEAIGLLIANIEEHRKRSFEPILNKYFFGMIPGIVILSEGRNKMLIKILNVHGRSVRIHLKNFLTKYFKIS